MAISVYGTDHRDSSIEYRERLISNIGMNRPSGYSTFITCNRVEIYGHGADPRFDRGYAHHGEGGVFRHLVALACGLKSRLLGERQIVDQLGVFAGSADRYLKGLIGGAIAEARLIRERFGIDNGYTVADAVYRHAGKRGLLGTRTVIMGSGRIAEMIAERFSGASPLSFVSGKHHKRAKELASRFGAEVYERAEMGRALKSAGVLVCATKSPHLIITRKDAVGSCAIYDISVPRNVDPALGAIDLEGLGDEFDSLNVDMETRALCAARAIEAGFGT